MNLLSNHRVLLADRIRMAAYREAIHAVVKPGDIVADLGTGTGVLAIEALTAGAAHVHAVEVEPQTLAIARKEIAKRGLADRVTFYAGLSQRVKPKARVDVVITETFGNFGLNENVLALLHDARTRWLQPGGTLIPSAVALTIAPLSRIPRSKQYTVGGLTSARVKTSTLLGQPATLPRVDLQSISADVYETTVKIPMTKKGQLVGFGGWFTAWLTDTIRFVTGPDDPATHWQQAILPLRYPVPVQAGQCIELWLQVTPDRSGLQSIVSYDFVLS